MSGPAPPVSVQSSTPVVSTSASPSPFRFAAVGPSRIVSAFEPPSTTTLSVLAPRFTWNSISDTPRDSLVLPGANGPPVSETTTICCAASAVTKIEFVFLTVAVPHWPKNPVPFAMILSPERVRVTVSSAALIETSTRFCALEYVQFTAAWAGAVANRAVSANVEASANLRSMVTSR